MGIRKKNDYCNLSAIAGVNALSLNGLLESTLNQPLCFCQDSDIIRKFETSSKVCVKKDLCGVCFPQVKCPGKCLNRYDYLCKH